MTDRPLTRRTVGRLIGGSALATLMPLLPAAVASPLTPTPRQTAGPFYPVRLPDDVDNDLVHFAGASTPAAGTPLRLTGRVLDAGGRAVRGSVVEIWQCDVNGRYHHATDRPGGADGG